LTTQYWIYFPSSKKDCEKKICLNHVTSFVTWRACCILYPPLCWCTDLIRVIHRWIRIDVSYNKYMLNNPQKYQKSWKNLTNSLKKWRFCHARHETVTLGSSKRSTLILVKQLRLWLIFRSKRKIFFFFCIFWHYMRFDKLINVFVSCWDTNWQKFELNLCWRIPSSSH
jgi:hypothetical protein